MKKLLKLLDPYRFMLFWLLILVLFGFSLWQIQKINQAKPNQAYIKSQQKEQITKLTIKDSLKQQLERLIDTPINIKPDNKLGSSDPFNP